MTCDEFRAQLREVETLPMPVGRLMEIVRACRHAMVCEWCYELACAAEARYLGPIDDAAESRLAKRIYDALVNDPEVNHECKAQHRRPAAR